MGALGVIFAILKIIGIILLALLAIVLILVCVVLFVPFVYSFKVKKYEEITGDINVSWFFGLIVVWVIIEDGKPVTKVKLMGRYLDEILEKRKTKKKRKKKHKKKDHGKKKKQNKKVSKELIPEESTEVPQKKEVTTAEVIKSDDAIKKAETKVVAVTEEAVLKKSTQEDQKVETEEDQKVDKKEQNSVSPMYKRVKIKKMQADSSKVDNKKDALIDEKDKKEAKKLADEVSDIAQDVIEEIPIKVKVNKDYFINMPFEEKKEVINAVVTLMKRVFTGVLPENVYVNVTIGTGDPQTTGYVLALAGVIKGIIHEQIYVKGKFDEAFFEGEVGIEGKIQLIKFVRALIRFILQKPIRKIIIIYWKGRGE